MDTESEAIELPEGVLLKRVQPRPSMAKVDGLWVHQGAAETGQNGTASWRASARSGATSLPVEIVAVTQGARDIPAFLQRRISEG
jgi:hypothetical protein